MQERSAIMQHAKYGRVGGDVLLHCGQGWEGRRHWRLTFIGSKSWYDNNIYQIACELLNFRLC